MGDGLKPPHLGWVVLVAGIVVGMLVEAATILVTWRLFVATDHAQHVQFQAQVDSVNAKLRDCYLKSCVFTAPRDTVRRPVR